MTGFPFISMFMYTGTFSTPPVYSVANTQMNLEEYHSTELQSFYSPSVGAQQNSSDLDFYYNQAAMRRCEWCLVKLSELNDRDGYCDRDLCAMCMVKYNQNQIYLQSNGIATHANSQQAMMSQQPFMPQELVRSQQPIMPQQPVMPLQPIIPQRPLMIIPQQPLMIIPQQPIEQTISQQSTILSKLMMPQETISRQRSTISSLKPAIPQLQTTPLLQPTTPQQVIPQQVMLQQVISQKLQDKTNMIFVNDSHVPLSNYDKIVTSSWPNYNQFQQNKWSSQYRSTKYNNIAIPNTTTAGTSGTIAVTTIAISQSATQQIIQNNTNSNKNNHEIYTKLNKIFSNSNTGKSPKMFICQICKKGFTSYSYLKRHSRTVLHKNILETFHQKTVASTVLQSVASESFNNNYLLKPASTKFSSNILYSLGEIRQLTNNQRNVAQQSQSIHGSLTNVVDSQTSTFQYIQSYSNSKINTNSYITVANSNDSN